MNAFAQCVGVRTNGEPCASPLPLDDNGYCPTHRPGGLERLTAAASKGGLATTAKLAGESLTAADLREVHTMEEALAAQLDIRNFVALRRCSHHEANAMNKSLDNWLRMYTSNKDARIVELLAELDRITAMNEELRLDIAKLRSAQARA